MVCTPVPRTKQIIFSRGPRPSQHEKLRRVIGQFSKCQRGTQGSPPPIAFISLDCMMPATPAVEAEGGKEMEIHRTMAGTCEYECILARDAFLLKSTPPLRAQHGVSTWGQCCCSRLCLLCTTQSVCSRLLMLRSLSMLNHSPPIQPAAA